jgi:hypothetical protein
MKLMGWAKQARPSFWYRNVLPLASIVGLFGVATLFFLTAMQVLNAPENAVHVAHDQYIQEAHKLLSAGVTPQNQSEAIRLLLALDSSYQGSVPAFAHGSYYIQSP